MLPCLSQSPRDPGFVQDPYAFYDRARQLGPFFHWQDYGLDCATSYAAVNAILRDRRFGREVPPHLRAPRPAHTAPFYAVDDLSMLEQEPPGHTRLRGLVLRAFTSRRIKALAPEIASLSHALIDGFPKGEFDLLRHFATILPVIIIARLLGVPETRAADLTAWSNAMVKMYIPGRSEETERAAAKAAQDFAGFMRAHIDARRHSPADDLITHLIAAEQDGERLTSEELISTCILLLNAGHEATVHSIGNAVNTLLTTNTAPDAAPIAAIVEETIRFDPPLHMFTRLACADVEIMGHNIKKDSTIALLLAAANRDPEVYDNPASFQPLRPARPNLSFGAGLHFCIGAPLARLELQTALPILFSRLPGLRLANPARYSDSYHFHGLQSLIVKS